MPVSEIESMGGVGATIHDDDDSRSYQGTDGDDVFHDAAGNDTYLGGAGSDVLSFKAGGRASGDFTIGFYYLGFALADATGTGGVNSAKDVERVEFTDTTINVATGTHAKGKLTGGAGRDILIGTPDDTLEGGAGDDYFLSGYGSADAVSYASAPAAVAASLNKSGLAQDTGGAGVDTLFGGFEVLIGSAFNDTLAGYAGINQTSSFGPIYMPGDDVLDGGGGDDVFLDSNGHDLSRGGDGNDLFHADHSVGNDTIDGGAGVDTLSFKRHGGLRAGYTITALDSGAIEIKGAGFSDRAANVEALEFADQIVSVADLLPKPVPIVLTTGFRDAAYFVDASGYVWLRSGANSIPTASDEVAFADGTLFTSRESAAARVHRLYEAGLDRSSDQAGQSFWTAALEDGASLADLAQGFISSPEFAARFGGADAPPEVFVGNLYRNVLGREGEAAGMEYWASLLVTNAFGREDVLVGFSESAENKLNTAGTIARGVWVMDKDSPTIARLYDTLLGRNPDEEGLMHWNALIDRGDASIRGIAANFMQLPEYTSRFGGLGNGDFVERLYQATLHRDSDAEGKAAWLGGLDSGALTRADVVLAFSESLEHQKLTQERFLSESDYGITFV